MKRLIVLNIVVALAASVAVVVAADHENRRSFRSPLMDVTSNDIGNVSND